MKIKEAVERQKKKHSKMLEVRERKGADYAQDQDCLANFKVMADVQGTLEKYGYGIPIDKPHGVAAWHLLHKLIRILNLWNKDAEPQNESIEDTHIDLENYSELAEECYIDYKKEKL